MAISSESVAAEHERGKLQRRVGDLEQQLAQAGAWVALHLHVSDPEKQQQVGPPCPIAKTVWEWKQGQELLYHGCSARCSVLNPRRD